LYYTTPTPGNYGTITSITHLFHEASFSISISVLLGVKLVHHAGLSLGRSIRAIILTIAIRAVSSVIRAKILTSTMGAVRCVISISQRCGTTGTSSSEGTANSLWLTGESITSLFASGQSTALALELVHGDRGQLGGCVVLGLILVDFVDRDSGVNNGRLNCLLLDDGLNILMDVVVDMLACNGGVGGCGVLGLADSAGIFELGLLGLKALLDVIVIAMLDISMLYASKVVAVLLWENFPVLDGLDGGVVMILMNFAVNGCGDILVVSAGDILVGDRWVNSLVDGGIMLSILGEETRNCCLCLVHFDWDINFIIV